MFHCNACMTDDEYYNYEQIVYLAQKTLELDVHIAGQEDQFVCVQKTDSQ